MEARSSQDGLADIVRATSVLANIGLADASDVNKVISMVSAEFFTEEARSLGECVQLSQIAAKLNVNAGGVLRFATQDSKLRGVDEAIIYDPGGSIERLVPAS